MNIKSPPILMLKLSSLSSTWYAHVFFKYVWKIYVLHHRISEQVLFLSCIVSVKNRFLSLSSFCIIWRMTLIFCLIQQKFWLPQIHLNLETYPFFFPSTVNIFQTTDKPCLVLNQIYLSSSPFFLPSTVNVIQKFSCHFAERFWPYQQRGNSSLSNLIWLFMAMIFHLT